MSVVNYSRLRLLTASYSHYTKSHKQINQFSITPVGPEPNILPLDEEVPAAKAAMASK